MAELCARAARSNRGITDTEAAGRPVPWPEILDRAHQTAHRLLDLGLVVPGTSTVALVGDPSSAMAVALIGAWLSGACVTFLPVGTTPAIQADVAARLAATGATCVIEVDRVRAETDGALPRVWVADLERPGPTADALPAVGDDWVVLRQRTSGSTGPGTFVEVTATALVAHLREIADRTTLDPEDTVLTWLPLNHDMGLIAFFVLPFFLGCDLATMSTRSFARHPLRWMSLAGELRATASGAPTFAYHVVRKRVGSTAYDLGRLRFMGVSAEPVVPEVVEGFCAALAPSRFDPKAIFPAYGLAEAILLCAAPPLGRGLEVATMTAGVEYGDLVGQHSRFTKLGTTVPSIELSVRDAEGAALGAAEFGHIWIRGRPVVAPPSAGDWYDTRDIGCVLDDGELVVASRADDILIVRGRKLPPEHLEAAARGVDGVRSGGVVAFSVDGAPVLLVESPDPDGKLRERVRRAVLKETGVSARIALVSEGHVLRTTSGKLRRQASRANFVASRRGATSESY